MSQIGSQPLFKAYLTTQGLVLTNNGDLWVFFPGQWRYRDFYSDIHVQIQFQIKMYRVMSLNKKLGPRPNSLKVRLLA